MGELGVHTHGHRNERVLKFSVDEVIKIQFHNDHNAVKRIIRNLLAFTALFSLQFIRVQ